MKLAIFAVGLVLALPLFLAHPSNAAHRVALVIGNGNYRNAPALSNSESNATAVTDMFRQAAFDVVTTEYDVDPASFNRAVAQFKSEAVGSDIAVIYYSGYGGEISGVNVLMPVADKLAGAHDIGEQFVRLDTLVNAVAGAKRLRLVLLDALHGNPFAAGPRPISAAQPTEGGLAKPAPPAGTLIAYAAAAGTVSEEGDAKQSIYTAALLHNLSTPGLDIRLAFGRVLVEVQKNTGGRQTPFVYGSLGGGNISLIPPLPDRPMVDLAGEKTDYGVVERINTALAWEVFMVQHPTGFYVSVARERLRLVENEAAAPATEPPAEPPPPPPGPQTAELEQPPVPGGGEQLPDVGTPAIVSLAQQELARLGCYTGADTGTLDEATREAIRRYEKAIGQPTEGVADITKDFVATLENQKKAVCLTTCPPGQAVRDNQCVEVGKSPPVASRGNETPPKRIARPAPPTTPTPARPAGQASGAPARSPVATGVGF